MSKADLAAVSPTVALSADPTGPANGEMRVIRGGTWSRGPLDCRSANRFGLSGATSLWVGFRVVCDSPPSEEETKELAKLQGIWVTEYTEHDGIREMPDSRHVIIGNRYLRIDDGQVEEDGIIKIDLSGPVKKIDYQCVKGVYEGKTWKGIYQIDGAPTTISAPSARSAGRIAPPHSRTRQMPRLGCAS